MTLIRAMLLAAIGLSVGIALMATRGHDHHRRAEAALRGEAVHWRVLGLEAELSRFLAALKDAEEQGEDFDRIEVARRLDALWTRAAVLQEGPNAELLRHFGSSVKTIGALVLTLQAHEASLLNNADEERRSGAAAVRRLIADLEDLRTELDLLSAQVRTQEAGARTDARSGLIDADRAADVTFDAAMILAVFLTLVLFVEGRRDNFAVSDRRRLAEQAKEAARTKTRFLSMMSHELRTPMNGMIGVLQLLKQSRLNDAQLRLIEQAERSGVQMAGLMGDILELSEIQEERREITEEAFRPEKLVTSLSELLAAPAIRNRTRIDVQCAPGTPGWVIGDYPRLRQALSHIAANLVGDHRVRGIELLVSHDRGELVSEFRIETFTTSDTSQEGAVLPGDDPNSLGLTVARGMIDAMGGSMKSGVVGAGRSNLVVRVSARPTYPRQDAVRIVERSQTSALLLEQSVESSGRPLWSTDMDAGQVDIVLFEVPAENEAQKLEALRQAHPLARIIAVGSPLDPELYDGLVAGPGDANILSALLARRVPDARTA